jgi:hypothetical protein
MDTYGHMLPSGDHLNTMDAIAASLDPAKPEFSALYPLSRVQVGLIFASVPDTIMRRDVRSARAGQVIPKAKLEMIGLIYFGLVLCASLGGFGIWLLVQDLRGVDVFKASAVFKVKGMDIEGPVGLVAALGALLLGVWLVSLYSPALVGENEQLRLANVRFNNELQYSQQKLDAAEKQLRDEKSRADALANQVRARTTDKEQADIKYAASQSNLLEKRAELAHTQGLLASETGRANYLSGQYAALAKQFSDEQLARREAQQQGLAAWQSADRMALSEKQRIEFDGIEKGVLALNDALTFLKIAPVHWPRIEGKNAVATYEIFHKAFEADQTRPRGAGLFEFNSEEHTIRGDYQGRLKEALRTEISALICETARRAIVESVSISEAVRNMRPIRDYDVDGKLIDTLVEFQYARMRLQIMAGSAYLLVRGYADGEQGPWRRNLDPSLATVRLHEIANPNVQQPEYALTFRPYLTQVAIGQGAHQSGTYGNNDLPNLRGEVASRIISALVGTCPQSTPNTAVGEIPVEVLQGRVYPQHSEPDRKARVHLLVFLKER